MPDLRPPEEFQATLPKKRMAAACVLRDGRDRFLVVRPTYKDCWEIPGGAVDAAESPRAAARREVLEELALDLDPGPLRAVDYCHTEPGHLESVHFLFDGGVLTSGQMAAIDLPANELSEFRFLDLAGAQRLLCPRVGRRLAATFGPGSSAAYFEDGADPLKPVHPQFPPETAS